MLIYHITVKSLDIARPSGVVPVESGSFVSAMNLEFFDFLFHPSRAKKNQQALNPVGFSDLDFSRPVQYIDLSRSLIDAASITLFQWLCNFSSSSGKYFHLCMFPTTSRMNLWTHSVAYHVFNS